MARETYSLDFTQPEPGKEESDTPLCPGYQITHTPAEDGRGPGTFQVRRITLRVNVRMAARGVHEEYYTYPGEYATFDAALVAAKAAFAADGPGDEVPTKVR